MFSTEPQSEEDNSLLIAVFYMKTSVENKILAGFVASVAALSVIGWMAYRTTNQFIID